MKKFLIIAGILIVGLFAGFFLIGVISPTVTYESEVLVNKPVTESWSVFTDSTRMGEWLEGYKDQEQISGESNSVGSKYKMTFLQNGEEIILTEEITAYEELERFNFILEADALSSEVAISFSEESGRTRIHATSLVKGKNPIYRSMFALMKGTFAEQDQTAYDNLKLAIEGE